MGTGFTVSHTVRFHETDAAGVVYFANGLTICHGAYEASLAAVGINLAQFFSPQDLAYPIVQATIDFRYPMACGDILRIWLQPQRLDQTSFEVQYRIFSEQTTDHSLAEALTRHVCIDPHRRNRHSLPAEMELWLHRWGI
jgi:1,4-dihydroxy-2-naphthoyl-CoA hydrolase